MFLPLNEERLSKLSFLEYLKYMKERVDGVHHRKKTDFAYSEARDLSRHIIARYVGETKQTWEDYGKKGAGMHFRLDQGILDKYRTKGSDKSKEGVIDEWRKETSYDLSSYIMALERHAKENPGTPLVNEEI
jgi:hypothetical protein